MNNLFFNKEQSGFLNGSKEPVAPYIEISKSSLNAWYNWQKELWNSGTLPVSGYFDSIAYGNGKFVSPSYGNNDNKFAVYSEDGINWTQANLPNISVRYGWEACIFGNGRFVAFQWGDTPTIYSDDGINWQRGSDIIGYDWRGGAYGNGKFVITNHQSTKYIYSEDGINWEQGTAPFASEWSCFGFNKFYIFQNNGSQGAYSEDGINWTTFSLPISDNWINWHYANGIMVVIAQNSNNALYSTDGINWYKTNMPNSRSWWRTTYDGKKFITIFGNSNIYAYSENGIDWYEDLLPITFNTHSIASSQDTVVILGNGNQFCYKKKDNIYTLNETPTTQDIVYSNPDVIKSKSLNVSKVGSVTVSDNYIASNFTSGANGCIINDDIKFSEADNWDIVINCKRNSVDDDGYLFDFCVDSSDNGRYGTTVMAASNSDSSCGYTYGLTFNGSSWVSLEAGTSISYTVDTSKYYYIKMSYDSNTGYLLSISEDDINYTVLTSSPTTTRVYSGLKYLLIGGYNIYYYYGSVSFNGTIDLSKSYIKMNGEEVWRGVCGDKVKSATSTQITLDNNVSYDRNSSGDINS